MTLYPITAWAIECAAEEPGRDRVSALRALLRHVQVDPTHLETGATIARADLLKLLDDVPPDEAWEDLSKFGLPVEAVIAIMDATDTKPPTRFRKIEGRWSWVHWVHACPPDQELNEAERKAAKLNLQRRNAARGVDLIFYDLMSGGSQDTRRLELLLYLAREELPEGSAELNAFQDSLDQALVH